MRNHDSHETVRLLIEGTQNWMQKSPYKGGWRFSDERRCLPGTRQDFLEYVVKRVENPKSKPGLILFGQASTGKSSIAYGVARRFAHEKRLGSYFAFLQRDPKMRLTESSRHLRVTSMITIMRSNALGRVVKDLALPGPILVIIDALDESGATFGNKGLHTFLAQRLADLPPNFRVLITSRPENGIEPAFTNTGSAHTLYMDDPQLAASTEQDINIYLKNELPADVFKDYGGKLAMAAKGLFQWAAVACGFINSIDSLGLSTSECVQRLLGHSRGRKGEGLLDSLYEQVLREYFKSDEAQVLFRSVIGQVFAAFEPLSVNSLIALRRHAPIDHPEDDEQVSVTSARC